MKNEPENYKVGDVVILKSGSPKMTIEELQDKKLICVWMSENKLYREIFISTIIEKYY